MKLTRLLLFALLGMTIMMSCGGDDEEEMNKLDPEGDCLTADIDGEAYNGETITSIALNDGTLSITSVQGSLDPKTFTITIGSDNGFGPGTYSIDTINSGDDLFFATYSTGLLLTTYTSMVGTLVVSELDTGDQKIKGTFNFEGETSTGETVSVTNGAFDLGYE